MDKKEYNHQWYLKHKEIVNERRKQRYKEIKEIELEKNKQWRKDNPSYYKEYFEENKNDIYNNHKEWRNTKKGRSNMLLCSYKQNDKKQKRGECTITAQWIVDNIFSGQICFYCKETDWKKLGCDRINNDLPHTPDNVVPCCEECNTKRGRKSFEEFCKEMANLKKC